MTPSPKEGSMADRHVVSEKCKGDGICVEVCPKHVLELHEGRARTTPGREVHCLDCGQCVAACAPGALSVSTMAADRFEPLKRPTTSPEDLAAFFKARRSVRTFKPDPVPREVLQSIVDLAATAPMGFVHTTEILVIDSREEIQFLSRKLRDLYAKLVSIHANPVGRVVIRLKRGAEVAHALDTHVIPIVKDDNEWQDRTGRDRYLYGAPVVMLFHANRWEVAYDENALICATYAMLAAHAHGLGSTMLSIVPPGINNFPDLRPRYGIPEDNKVLLALVMGYPKYRYQKSIRRELKGVRFFSPPQ
jgi:nitroreductase/NAD-dependent dihydropyrimidine dehydrogenase PreA subunit